MKLAVVIHEARLGAREFKVIRPARPLTRAVLVDRDRYLHASLDHDGARRTAGLWTLAASSPNALVHLPIRANRPPYEEVRPGTRQLDLVLLHHSLQFAPSRWPELRARLGPGRPRTVDLRDGDQATAAWIDHETRRHHENRDRFHQRVHAETLFMTGSARLLRETAGPFYDVARFGPGHVPPRSPHARCCPGLYSPGLLGDGRELHIAYHAQWPPRPGTGT
ncbi:hypothetical protein [Streptomyces sp. G-G2]|uniref:hypothetical protein n=1 Tax=Streptomyces sp. G-G2 TaxID=3046201 RepID=UPI0024B9B509|nr:hypothetical protein [Streptomyces sp. G-G2]MDJ0380282.1 hypothetical protein [Streptomyces sp. G-G2]